MNTEVTPAGLLRLDGIVVLTPFRVRDAVASGSRVIVLYDPDEAPRPYGSFSNLVALDNHGAELWKAELPQSPDSYYRLVSATPLVVDSVGSFRCTIDPESGRLLEVEWLK
jgi:hypothetical protein